MDNEPDYVVVVRRVVRLDEEDEGLVQEEEFHHNSLCLRHQSQYFRALFDSDMIENVNNRVVFDDMDPEEWKELSKFFDPRLLFSPTAASCFITEDNVKILLRWSDYLQMTDLLDACELSLHRMLFEEEYDWWSKFHFELASEAYAWSLQYRFQRNFENVNLEMSASRIKFKSDS